MSGLLGKKSQSTTIERYTGIQLSTSVYASAIPMIYGRQRVNYNLLWYGNFTSTQSGGGGKGGGGGGSSSWNYITAFMAGLCIGPIIAINQIWHDKAIATLTTEGLTYSLGGSAPPIWSFLTSYTPPGIEFDGYIVGTTLTCTNVHKGLFQLYMTITGPGVPANTQITSFLDGTGGDGDYLLSTSSTVGSPGSPPSTVVMDGSVGTIGSQAIPYDHIVWVGSSSYNLGSSASLPNLSFEIDAALGYDVAHGIYDADPAAYIPDYLTEPVRGAGFPGTVATLTGTTNTYQAYCHAMDLLVSPIELTQRSANEFVRDTMQITNSDVVLSAGVLKIVPYADQPVSRVDAAGTTWSFTPNLTPIYSFTDDDYILKIGDEPVQLKRTPRARTYNYVNVEYLERSDMYNIAVAPAYDLQDIQSGFRRIMPTVTLHQITRATVARTVAQFVLQTNLYERNYWTWVVRSDYSLIEPMDVVEVTDAVTGMVQQAIRVTETQDSEEDEFTITGFEISGVSRSTPQYNWSASQGYAANYNSPPGSVASPVIFQMPAIPASLGEGVTIGIAAGGPSSSTNWGGCLVQLSIDGGATYALVGYIGGDQAARYGTLTANLGAVADPDTTSTLGVLLTNTNQQLSTAVTHADADANQTLIWVQGNTAGSAEVMSYGAASLVSAGQYNLSYLRRNLYGSQNEASSTGKTWVRLDGSIFQISLDPGMAGETVHFKFQSFNIYGHALEDISDVPAYAYTVPTALAVSGTIFLVPIGPCAVDGYSIYKIASSSAAWNSFAYSPQAFANGCFVSVRVADVNHEFVGLATNPTNTTLISGYPPLDYAIYLQNGTIVIVEAGIASAGLGTYAVGDSVEVRYDGVTIRYFHNGSLIHATRAAAKTLCPEVVLYEGGAVMSGVQYGPATSTSQASGNWLTNYAWVVGASGTQGNFVDNYDGVNEDSSIVMSGASGAPLGPYGTSEALWKTVGAGANANGGWDNSGDLYGIDSSKTYRSVVWFYWNGVGLPSFYHGADWSGSRYTCAVGTQTVVNNPYFSGGPLSGAAPNKWYLSVGILHGSGYTGASSGLSGIYDPETGENVSAGADYNILAGAAWQMQRVYQFYANNPASVIYFAKPRFEEMNGDEPSIATLLSPAGALAYADNLDEVPDGTTYSKTLAAFVAAGIPFVFQGAYSGSTTYKKGNEVSSGGNYYLYINATPSSGNAPPNPTYWQLISSNQFVATGNAVVNGATVGKVGGATAYDSSIYSVVGYSTVHISAKSNTTLSSMLGLSTNPSANPSYVNGNYMFTNGGVWGIYESGTLIGNFGTSALSDIVEITYDGSTVTYLINKVVVRTVSVTGLTLYAFGSFFAPGSGWNSIDFGPTTNLAVLDTGQLGDDAATEVYVTTAGTVSYGPTGAGGLSVAMLSIALPARPQAYTLLITGFISQWISNDAFDAVHLNQHGSGVSLAFLRGSETGNPGGNGTLRGTLSVAANTATTIEFTYQTTSSGISMSAANLVLQCEMVKK